MVLTNNHELVLAPPAPGNTCSWLSRRGTQDKYKLELEWLTTTYVPATTLGHNSTKLRHSCTRAHRAEYESLVGGEVLVEHLCQNVALALATDLDIWLKVAFENVPFEFCCVLIQVPAHRRFALYRIVSVCPWYSFQTCYCDSCCILDIKQSNENTSSFRLK